MKFTKIILIICAYFCALNNSYAQISLGGVPLSLTEDYKQIIDENIETYSLPALNNKEEEERAQLIQQEDCSSCQNRYYGTGIDVSIDLINEATLVNTAKGKLFLLEIESQTALGFQFYFNKFKLPDGAKLFIYNESQEMTLGAFSSDNNPKEDNKPIPFGTQHILGKKVTIEYFEPHNASFAGQISITKVIHIFKDFSVESQDSWGKSAKCHIDVACPLGNGWDDEISSVALILTYTPSGNLAKWCTGALINNTANNGTGNGYPFFLTANHCAIGSSTLYDYSTWTFVFHHQAQSCNGTSNTTNASIYSSSLVSQSNISDYLLLDLNATVNNIIDLELCLSGWTAQESNLEGPFTGIHHPNGDVKKISQALNANTYASDFWKLDWDQGTAESVSDGSPLYDNNKRIMGQMTSPPEEPCHTEKLTLYGKFSTAFNDDLKNYLQIGDNWETVTDTYCPIKDPDTEDPDEPGDGGMCVAKYKTMLQDGFKIDGIVNEISEICIGSPIIISSVENEELCSGTRTIWARKEVKSEYWNCDDLDLLHPYSKSMHIFKCYATFYWLYISLTQCDANLNDIGPSYGAWISMQNNSSTDMIPQGVTLDYGGNGGTVGGINSFPLTDYLPSSNIVFLPGQYYKVKIATSIKGNWFENTQYMHLWEDNAHHNGITHTENIRGKDVTLENATVQQNIQVIGSNSVTILPNSILDRGLYTIDSYMNCYNFKKGTSNGNSNGSSNNNTDDSSNHFDDFTESKEKSSNVSEFSIYPNPNNGVFKIAFEDTDYKNYEIKITDLQGRLIKQISNLNTSVQEMSIPGGTKGVYLIQIIDKTTQEITFGKVIIQ